MAKAGTELIFTVRIKPEISFRDAIKMRLAGGRYMKRFWETFANLIQSNAKKGESGNVENRNTD